MRSCIKKARGIEKADVLYKNAVLFNPFTGEWDKTAFATAGSTILGTGTYQARKEVDLLGSYVIPGLIDAHVHIESSLLTPREYGRLVTRHGTTTVIADPHEIANTCGCAGIDYIIRASRNIPLDIFIMFPSCVPATPFDESAEVLSQLQMEPYRTCHTVIGLGEMMNVPGVLEENPDVMQKLDLWDIRDGHAPGLSGKDLNAYLCAGLQSDHETTNLEEGREKLQKGMYLFIREGSTEKNLCTLLPLVTPFSVSQTSFCTDDRHADLLNQDGHIDDCIRKSIQAGLEPEFAIRMGSLSAAERFGLKDRGALVPGRRADFCLVQDLKTFEINRVFKNGVLIQEKDFLDTPVSLPQYRFRTQIPEPKDIMCQGYGKAHVIALVKDQISTIAVTHIINSEEIPDFSRDILKVVVASRYDDTKIGVGYVSGFSLQNGAIASSISHDSHNIIAIGTSDALICDAIREVVRHRGAMTAIADGTVRSLPLHVAGLMADLPYETVCHNLQLLSDMVLDMGSICNPFMYLSFLALTVIPEIRITEKGLFDVTTFRHIPVFFDDA